MEHTYFYREAKWLAKGTYWDGSGTESDAAGEVEVSHESGMWFLDGFMEIKPAGKDPVVFKNSYEMVPPEEGAGVILTRSHNPALGWFKGFIAIVGDTILASAETEDGVYRTTESLIQIAEWKYENRGCLLKDGAPVSSWSMTVEKI